MTEQHRPSTEEVAAAHLLEAQRREAADLPIRQYQRGLLTLDEFIAGLAGVRLDERTWEHPGPTFPTHTVATFARLLVVEAEEAGQDG